MGVRSRAAGSRLHVPATTLTPSGVGASLPLVNPVTPGLASLVHRVPPSTNQVILLSCFSCPQEGLAWLGIESPINRL